MVTRASFCVPHIFLRPVRQVHVLMALAIHILWHTSLVAWILQETSLCERSIHEEWTNVTLYNRHELFYETLIVAIVTYLTGIIPRAILLDRTKLFELAANNLGIRAKEPLSTAFPLKPLSNIAPFRSHYSQPQLNLSTYRYDGAAALPLRLCPTVARCPAGHPVQ